MTTHPALEALVARYDPHVFVPARESARIRLAVVGHGEVDAILTSGTARLETPAGDADAEITADGPTWTAIAQDLGGGMAAFQSGRLSVRRDLHLGVGFLAATSGASEPGRLRFRAVATRRLVISMMEAGQGPPVLAVHGIGATKGSFLPTLAALADRFRFTAMDLPGFGDSDMPIGAPYDARFFASAVVDFLDALGLERVHVVGNSLGGRVALELGLRHPERVHRLALLAPSLAWRQDRPWAGLLRLVPPELGLVQPAPRPVVEAIVQQLIPGAADGWGAAGVDEFLRTYLTPAGRAAFYATARQIYLEEPDGPDGFWPRLRGLRPEALFVWGRRDRFVPLAFARHVSAALPAAQQLVLECGHVPQVELPEQTHAAVRAFLAGG